MSSDALDLTHFERGGLFRVTSANGGSTRFSLFCLSHFYKSNGQTENIMKQNYIWISDEGYLYPGTLYAHLQIPLSCWLFAKPKDASEAWKATLEAAQSGLFAWILSRPSKACAPTHLRRLQVAAEKTRTRLILIGKAKLPHWMFRLTLDVEEGKKDVEKNPLHSHFYVRTGTGRSLSLPNSQSQFAWGQ